MFTVYRNDDRSLVLESVNEVDLATVPAVTGPTIIPEYTEIRGIPPDQYEVTVPEEVVPEYAQIEIAKPPYPRVWDGETRSYTRVPVLDGMSAVYRTSDGALLSESVRPVDPLFLAEGVATSFFETVPTPRAWDPVTLTYIPLVTRGRRLSRLMLTRRFSFTENVALKQAFLDVNTPLQTRAALETLNDFITRSDFIDLDDADVAMGVGMAVDVLISAGLVLPENRDARIAAVLADVQEYDG